jgi:hypothetical protein
MIGAVWPRPKHDAWQVAIAMLSCVTAGPKKSGRPVLNPATNLRQTTYGGRRVTPDIDAIQDVKGPK